MKTNKKILFFATAMLLGTACNKFLEVPSPATKAESFKVFADERSADAAVSGVYAFLVSANMQFFNGAITAYTGFCADEFANISKNTTYEPFRINAIPTENEVVASNFWSNAYKGINHVNVTIEGLQANQSRYAPQKYRQLIGEMYFTRALQYFYLVNLFGDVPLIISNDFEANALLPRTAKAKVYAQITEDLMQATANLSEGAINLRPNRSAAWLLLARVYLYLEKWELAKAAAAEVITKGGYVLEPLTNTFLATSKETIFQLMKPTANTAEAFSFVPSSATTIPSFAITDDLLLAFKGTDLRKGNWLKFNAVTGKNYYYPYKYKVRSGTVVSEYYVVLRLAEVYLISAEAKAQLNEISAAELDLDVVRKRAGLQPIQQTQPNLSKADLLALIANERRLEFFAEWGHRWFDLKRTGKANAVLGNLKGADWNNSTNLFPIPYREINYNFNLTQNDGYFK